MTLLVFNSFWIEFNLFNIIYGKYVQNTVSMLYPSLLPTSIPQCQKQQFLIVDLLGNQETGLKFGPCA